MMWSTSHFYRNAPHSQGECPRSLRVGLREVVAQVVQRTGPPPNSEPWTPGGVSWDEARWALTLTRRWGKVGPGKGSSEPAASRSLILVGIFGKSYNVPISGSHFLALTLNDENSSQHP